MVRFFYILPVLSVFVFFSCESERQVQFQVSGTNAALYAMSRAAQEGALNFSAPKKLEYKFDSSFFVPKDCSLIIEYEIDFPQINMSTESFSLGLNTGSAFWQLPLYGDTVCYYAIPVDDSFNGNFYIMLDSEPEIDKTSAPVFRIRSINFSQRFFGFSNSNSGSFISSPFVYRNGSSYVIDVPESAAAYPMRMNINASFSSAGAELEFANHTITAYKGIENLYIPNAMYPVEGRIILTGEEIMSFNLKPGEIASFPKPIKADPALIVEWTRENWRNPRYEVFCWDRFPSLLIFDFSDYEMQDRMLKRLAFFAEKTGFRGRLAYDEEIDHLHGWNAHDYRAEDLALFFNAARKLNFPLSNEELELEKILLNEKIIIETPDSIAAGEGAIISISRESPDYLRRRFMAHEGFHGLYFIDEEFRDFTRRRWEQLHITAKRFLTSFFSYQQYDTSDEYLLLNEFMAHVLQQSVPQAADYFGRQLPSILESTWRASELPPKNDATGTWTFLAQAFTAEAENFTNYVNRRWGLAAGRVWVLNIK